MIEFTWSEQVNGVLNEAGFPAVGGNLEMPYSFTYLGWTVTVHPDLQFIIRPPGGKHGEWQRLAGAVWRYSREDLPYVDPNPGRVVRIPPAPMHRIRAYIELAYRNTGLFSPYFADDRGLFIEVRLRDAGTPVIRTGPFTWVGTNGLWSLVYEPEHNIAMFHATDEVITAARFRRELNPYDVGFGITGVVGVLSEESLIEVALSLGEVLT